MSERCVGLMVSLRDRSQALEGIKVFEIAADIEALVVPDRLLSQFHIWFI
jgi:hypothetical protein